MKSSRKKSKYEKYFQRCNLPIDKEDFQLQYCDFEDGAKRLIESGRYVVMLKSIFARLYPDEVLGSSEVQCLHTRLKQWQIASIQFLFRPDISVVRQITKANRDYLETIFLKVHPTRPVTRQTIAK